MISLGLSFCSKTYRDEFSNSYKVLYRSMHEMFGSTAAYLPEILDSAQEAFDHLWVNGEKYVFSEHVVESGNKLFKHFKDTKECVTAFFTEHFETSGQLLIDNNPKLADDFAVLKQTLKMFDELWAEYEQKYVYELMVIESDARRFIIDSINAEAILSQDHMQLPTMQETKKEKRQELLENICQINAVANVEGKGRSDFEIALLERSEQIDRECAQK